MPNNNNNKLDVPTLEGWLWEAACKIRGEVDAPKYKDYILPLIFVARLSDVFEDEIAALAEEYGDEETAEAFVEEDHTLVRFYLPRTSRWDHLANLTTNVGQSLTDAVRDIARENPKLQGVIDQIDFNATASGQRVISDAKLKSLIDVLGDYRLGLEDVEPDILGRAYEYLLRKFAEGSGSSAGEFYTPREVAVLMARILDPEPGKSVYDPCSGSGGLLIKCMLRFKEKYGKDPSVAPLTFYGQELLASTFAISKMNIFIHDMDAQIKLGNTMNRPAFTNRDGSMQKFDYVTANPMWNQDFDQDTYENDTFDRFNYGYPPSGSADWGWIQHMYASLTDKGKLAVVLDTGAVARGSGSTGTNRERDIRKQFVENDLIEAVLLMPNNMFYNTSAPGIILVLNKDKKNPGEILLINGSQQFKKGRPKNFLTDDHIQLLGDIYLDWAEVDGISTVITKTKAIEEDCNLSPSRYVSANGNEETLDLADAVVQVVNAEAERKEADDVLKNYMKQLGFDI